MQEILKEVSENHMVSIDELTGSGRTEDLVLARKDAYKRLEQAGFGPVEIGRALNRDHSTVTRALVEPTKTCPKGHGPLRRDDREGIAACITCGYEEPLETLPTEGDLVGDKEQVTHYVPTPGKGKYADKPIKLEGHGRGFRYPDDIKVSSVREVEGGADKEEVCKRVGCHLITLNEWIAKYGGKGKLASNIKSLRHLQSDLSKKRFELLQEASVLNSRIEAVEEAIKILEEAKEK